MPHILITGASGFIGNRAAQAFRAAGWSTTLVGRRPISDPDYIQHNLASPPSTDLLAAIERSDVVLHAAARSSPWGSVRSFQQDNVQATRVLLDACRQKGIPRFLYVSSSSVYYQSEDQLGITEDTPQANPAVNVYAATKQFSEKLVRDYPGQWCVLRPRAVYGPGDTVLFPRILAAAKAGRLPLLVRESSPVIGDLIYIDNLTHYLKLAAERADVTGEFNLTDNEPVPISEYLLSVFDQLNIPRPTKTVSVKKAQWAALLLEVIYRNLLWWKEPPITRFGVHVFAYSKTFDISRTIQTFGLPPFTTAEGVRNFVEWIRREDPYS